MPGTRITGAAIRMRTAPFSFGATGPATGYRCALSHGAHKAAFRRCSSPQMYKRLKPGSYTFSVIAAGPDEPYHTPTRRTFKLR